MSSGPLSARVTELAAAPEGPPLKVNVTFHPHCTPDQCQDAVAELEKLAGAPVHFRSAIGIATAVVPRHRVHELERITAVQHVELDSTATYLELID